ncbi:MAG: TetR-like C-terminal domain-containing protein [Pseudomonadota bacterium]
MSQDRHTVLRARIVANATRILETEGLQALQARRLASDAGCAIGTLYNVFGGLDDVIIAANTVTLEQLGQRLVEVKQDHAGSGIGPVLSAFALAYLEFAIAHRMAWRTLFEHQMDGGKSVPDSYRDKQAQLFAIVEDTIAPFASTEAEAKLLSRAMFSAVHGLVALALDEKLGAYDEEATRQQIAWVVDAAAAKITSDTSELQSSP